MGKRTKVCPTCEKIFSYEIGKGRDRKHCSAQCQRDALAERQRGEAASLPECSTPGCGKRANRKGSGLCEACYMRMRRKGTTDYKPLPAHKIEQSAGYIWLREPGHPLSDSRGLVYEHRYVFYEHNGNGPFKCYWCGREVWWEMMHVDHLDDDKSNNNINNLAPSCPLCNQKRGRWKMVAKQQANGIQITYKGKTKTAGVWARDLGLSRSAFLWRLERWPIERVMETPKGNTGPTVGWNEKACHDRKTEAEGKERA